MKHLPIVFQSLDRIVGKERRSKLIHKDTELYALLHHVKSLLRESYTVGNDRMDLHIELTKNPDDPNLRAKTESLQNQIVELSLSSSWGYLGRAFVLWTPEVAEYGKTHITIAFFGNKPKPPIEEIRQLVLDFITKQS